MKILKHSILIILLLISVVSCNFSMPENKGKIVVTNQAENQTDKIIAVYAKSEDASDYVLYWNNEDGASYYEDAAFYIENGKYDVMIYVQKDNFFLNTESFQTGYKNPVEVKTDEYSFIYYDGNGIYQK